MTIFKRQNKEMNSNTIDLIDIVNPLKKIKIEEKDNEIYYPNINSIPIEILAKILSFVDDETLLTSVHKVNNYWRNVCKTHITINKFYNTITYDTNKKLCNIQYFNKIKEIELIKSDICDKGFRLLENLAQKTINVEKISFKQSNVFSSYGFYVIAKKFPNLKKIYIEECTQIDDKFFEMFKYGFKNLIKLSIYINNNITIKSIKYISNNCYKLKKIDLYKLDNIEDKDNDIDRLVKQQKNLTHFNLSNCKYLNGKVFNKLHEYTNNINSAYLVNTQIDDSEMTLLVENNKNINNLKMSFYQSNINNALNEISKNLLELKTLDISFNETLNDRNIYYISNKYCPKLETLSLKNNINITDRGFEVLFSQSPNIKHLDIGLLFKDIENNITNKTICFLVKYCKQIESIAIDNRCNLTDYTLNLISKTYQKTLKHISFNNCSKFTGKSIINLVNMCPKIESLIMNGCENLTNYDIIQIGRLNSNIKKLDIGGNNKLNNTLLKDISSLFKKLEIFNMTNNKYINKWGLRFFMDKAYKLKEINLLKCKKINYKLIEKYKTQFIHNKIQITEEDPQINIAHQLTESLYIGE